MHPMTPEENLRRSPRLMLWGRRLLIFGVAMALISTTPSLLVMLFPPLGDGFLEHPRHHADADGDPARRRHH